MYVQDLINILTRKTTIYSIISAFL